MSQTHLKPDDPWLGNEDVRYMRGDVGWLPDSNL
jgi:hypothetical protein